MATELLKSANGQVFRNTNGQVLKANYDKGNGYRLLTTNNEVRVDFTYNAEYTHIAVGLGDIGFNINPFISWRLTGGYGELLLSGMCSRVNDDSTQYQHFVVGAIAEETTNIMAFRRFLNDTYDVFANGKFSTIANRPNPLLDIEAIRIGRGTQPVQYNPNTNVLYYFFDRILTNDEILAIYNNRQVSEPITTSGLKIMLDYNKAEVLDFSLAQDGSDLRAGFRDMSGNNNHGYVMGISGTPQDVVNEVNANRIFTV